MTTHPETAPPYARPRAPWLERPSEWMRYLVPVARALYVAIFVMAVPGHFTAPMVAYGARQGVPLAGLAVPLAGIVAGFGALSVLFGYRARLGAWLLVLFLVPVTLTMHRFWGLADPAAAQLQQIMFMKNASMLGAALLVAYFGAGPVSIDERGRDDEPRGTGRS
jgi:putative oxidoreductase